jgi:two-component system cell cycle response regulator DivK
MKHVVVVEDDLHNAILFRKLLEKRGGYRVTVTESAEELFRCLKAGDVALVIMDVSLANTRWEGRPVNGVELARMLKSDPTTVGIPVVLATAHAMRGDAENLIADSGANDYIAKPILDHAAFLEQIKGMLEEAA